MKIESSTPEDLNGKGFKIAIILSRFNDSIGSKLVDNVVETLKSKDVDESDISITLVPGALEIPIVAKQLAQKKQYDVIIALGVIIRGETYHFELVAHESHRGLMDTSLQTDTPIIFGIITAENADQAIARAEKNAMNKGKEYAESALEMARLIKQLRSSQKDVE